MQLMRILIIFLLFNSYLLSQTKIIEIAATDLTLVDSTFFNINHSREIIQINKSWKVFVQGKDEWAKISVPCIFKSDEILVFQRKIKISKSQANERTFYLNFLGLNYSTEILFNSVQIYKGSPANIPFSVKIPSELITSKTPNLLTIKVEHSLDAKTTIPAKQRFLFPKSFAGFTRDVYLYSVPKIHISDLTTKYHLSPNLNTAEIYYNLTIEGTKKIKDSTSKFDLTFDILGRDKSKYFSAQRTVKILPTKTYISGKLTFQNAKLWSPENPFYYKIRIKLLENSFILDEYSKTISFYELKSNPTELKLNGNNFEFKGCVFQNYPTYSETKDDYSIQKQKLNAIKNLGFNSVRFAKAVPHPYALKLCEELGLLAIIELPINSVPESFFADNDYLMRVDQYISSFGKAYRNYSSVALVGLGSSFLSNSDTHLENLNFIRERLANYFDKKFFASFIGIPKDVKQIDFIGVELYATDIKSVFKNNQLIKNIFISEATYPNYNGTSSGYLTPFSIEAQAKYVEDVIDYSSEKLGGFFLNSFSKYSGDYPSFFTKFNKWNLYSIGITNNVGNNLTKNVVSSKLKELERVVIPIGAFTTDFPLFIIFTGIGLAVLLGILVNSKKKFREDATRAFLRPYNFFTDIRDHRVLLGFHTNILMLILAGIHSLLITNLIYFFKDNFFFEKILLSFGNEKFMSFIGELAWNPVKSFIFFFIATIIVFFIISALIKLMSVFLKTKVMFFNIYYVVVWSFLPLSVLLPLKLILYKILSEHIINIYIYILLVFYLIWIFQRILKGTYVIFDVSRTKVYAWGIGILAIIFVGTILYLQFTNYTISYILLSFKQYQLL